MSSVGGAIDGSGGLALTRSLSDLLSVIALLSPFHGPADKSRVLQKCTTPLPLGVELSISVERTRIEGSGLRGED
jgi:hypothetical protein